MHIRELINWPKYVTAALGDNSAALTISYVLYALVFLFYYSV